MATPELEFFFDVVSPYSYLAATRLAGLAERTGCTVRWRPFFLGGVMKATGNKPPATLPAKARWMVFDLGEWARHYDMKVEVPSVFPVNTLTAQRALVAASHIAGDESVPPFAMALFAAYWSEGRDISELSEIRAAAESVGLNGDAILAGAGEQENKDALRANSDEAVERGAFGAPALFIGERLYWGNDRLGLVEKKLKELST